MNNQQRTGAGEPKETQLKHLHDDFTPRAGQEYGTQYACANCDAEDGLFGRFYRVREEPTSWWMGLDENGQAHYFCDDCKTLGIGVVPSMP
ncbi:hypothetical protein [Burkholderia cepacia]|uniref:hypothetical protein n=1 Tax=Burkholderia cepacia TaxID=292 RepID=UPI002ABDCEE4|nr:hypothetical protein [Burkholderia cepacia]